MPKTKISEFDSVPANNTDINGINIAEGMLPSDVNNAIRTLMSDLKDLQAGTSGDTIPIAAGGTGATTAAAARTALGATTTGSNLFTSVSAAAARTTLGATTVGSNVFTLTNPSAITFPRFNADNTVSALDAATFRTAIGAGTGGGSVTSVAVSGGTTGLTVSGSPITTSGTITLAGTLAAVNGGTGQNTYAVGDLLVGGATNTLAKLADVATGNALISGGVGVAPSYGKIGLTTHISGTLAVANGGTGATTLTANNVLLGNGTSALQAVAPGTSGNVLTSNGTTWTSAAPAGGGDPIGSLQYMAGLTSTTYPGSSYLKCDGSIVSQSTYSTLFARLGRIPNAINTWVSRSTTGTVGNFTGAVVFLNNIFITGESTGWRTSTDAITWTNVSSGGAIASSGGTGKAYGMTFGNGLYVAFRSYLVGKSGHLQPATSTNLITWTSQSISGDAFGNTSRMRYLNNQYIALGTLVSTGGNAIYSSTNGITWTSRSISGLGSFLPSDAVFANGKYTIAATNGGIYSSTDLVTWSGVSLPSASQALGLAYFDSTYIAVPSNGARVFTSTDAVTWTVRSFLGGAGAITTDSTSPVQVSLSYIPESDTTVLFNSDSTGSRLIISSDTVNWLTVSTTSLSSYRPPLTYGNFVAVIGARYTSPTTNEVQRSAIYSYDTATSFALPSQLNANSFGIFSSLIAPNSLIQGGAEQQLFIKAL